MIENRHKVIDEKEGNKPSLRRTSTPTSPRHGQDGDDDRPTLKRRDDTIARPELKRQYEGKDEPADTACRFFIAWTAASAVRLERSSAIDENAPGSLTQFVYDPAATDFTVMVVPFTSPVTFAFAPASSLSLSSAPCPRSPAYILCRRPRGHTSIRASRRLACNRRLRRAFHVLPRTWHR